MSVLDKARRVYLTLKSRQNGCPQGLPAPVPGYDINDRNDQSFALLAADVPNAAVRGYDINDRNDRSPPGCPPHRLVQDQSGLDMTAAALAQVTLVGLDLETTGLNPRTDRIRLLSLACATADGGTSCSLIDCSVVDPRPLLPLLAAKELVIHHGLFDLGFLTRLGFVPGLVRDTLLLAQLLVAGTNQKVSLEACCARWLNHTLDKSQQKSDWSRRELTDSQLSYAATDAAVLVPLYQALHRQIQETGLERAAEIERRCLLGVVWLAGQGVAFDANRWRALACAAEAEADRCRQELDQAAPAVPGTLHGLTPWNWDSPRAIEQALAAAGCPLADTAEETLASVEHPLARLVQRYRQAAKRASTYGRDWLEHVAPDGRLYPSWKQCGAKTGRMACGHPNLQNIPRDRAYRRCFGAPPGRILVKADYSQIELRIAAKIANEAHMIAAYRRGEDLHALTARTMTGKATITPAERQLAKPVNFGLIYGLGAASLRRKAKTDYGLDLSPADAARYRRAFFTAYPAIRRWHSAIRRRRARETRTLAGRRVLVPADSFFGAKANYMVQGTGGDGVKCALALLWERRGEVPGAFPVLAVHDELVVECAEDQAEAVATWLRTAMIDGMAPFLDPVPVEVEITVAPTWGG
jgi:DNA polymerase-1